MAETSGISTVKIVMTGPFSSGKTRFIQTISERDSDEDNFVAMDFGRITIDETLILYIFGTPGARRFDFMLEILAEGMLGFIVMVDSRRPETFREARSMAQTFAAYAPTPYVIAANFQDHSDAWDVEALRIALHLDPDIPVVPCIATNKESVKGVMLTLLDEVLKWTMEAP